MSQHWVEYAGEERRRSYPPDRRRKKKKRRGGFMRRAAAVLVVIVMLFALKNVIGDHLILTKDGIVWSGDLDPVYQEAGNMSDTLRQLVKNNPETIDFVRDYQAKKDDPPAENVGEVTVGGDPSSSTMG